MQPFKYATITGAGGLSDGVDHTALVKIYVELATDNNGQNFGVDELVTGAVSGVRGTCVSWDPSNGILTLKDITPYNTGNINVGIAGYLYEFSHDSTIIDFVIQDSGQNYSSTPLLEIQGPTSPATESRNSETIPWGGAMGDIQATATVNMTTAADQVASITITNGGYGYQQTIDNSYKTHPYILFTDSSNNISDGKFASTPNGAIAQAILGGEKINGNAGASYRIKRIEYHKNSLRHLKVQMRLNPIRLLVPIVIGCICSLEDHNHGIMKTRLHRQLIHSQNFLVLMMIWYL